MGAWSIVLGSPACHFRPAGGAPAAGRPAPAGTNRQKPSLSRARRKPCRRRLVLMLLIFAGGRVHRFACRPHSPHSRCARVPSCLRSPDTAAAVILALGGRPSGPCHSQPVTARLLILYLLQPARSMQQCDAPGRLLLPTASIVLSGILALGGHSSLSRGTRARGHHAHGP